MLYPIASQDSVSDISQLCGVRRCEFLNLIFTFLPSSVPLEIECDDSMQRSQEAALSITKLTPSPSLASSSDSCEMTSPDPSDNSKLNSNQPGLLSAIEDHNSSFEKTDFRLVLNSTQNSLCESEILNASHESMDCHNISNDCIEDAHSLGSMNIDSPVHNSIQLSTTWDTTPDCSPIEYRRIAVGRLASTPEGRHSKVIFAQV